jgi:hypothetical protein
VLVAILVRVELQVVVFLLLVVVVVADVGVAVPLDVLPFTFAFQLLDLLSLGGDGRLQSGDPGLEAVDGVILLLVGLVFI